MGRPRDLPWSLLALTYANVVFTLNRPFYPASSAHPLPVLIARPREILIMSTQTARRRKTNNKNNRKFRGQASEMQA